MSVLNIIVAGIGGQGVITLSKLIAEAARRLGHNTVTAETHGLSQRGGSVEVHVRIGDAVAPLAPRGAVDVIVGLELMEGLRVLPYLKRGGLIILNNRLITPWMPATRLPEVRRRVQKVLKEVEESNYCRLVLMNVYERLRDSGIPLYTLNTYMLGALTAFLEPSGWLTLSAAIDSIKTIIRRGVETNIEALKLGYEDAKRFTQ